MPRANGITDVSQALRANTREAVSATKFGARGDESANDSASLLSALESSQLVFGVGTHLVQSELADGALVIQDSGFRLADARIVTDQVQKSAFRLISSTQKAAGVDITDASFTTPVDGVGGGAGNNHHALKLSGVDDAYLANLRVAGDLGISIHYGGMSLSDRGCNDVRLFGVTGSDLLGMGIEIFGSRYGSFYGISMHGDDGTGDRAVSHGLRLSAFDFAPNLFNAIDAHSDHFLTGASLQRNARHNHIRLTARDCFQGIQVFGDAEEVPLDQKSELNTIQVNAHECDYGLWNGGSNNTFICNISDSVLRGINTLGDGGTEGHSRGNRYSGRVINASDRLVNIASHREMLDLQLFGNGIGDTNHAVVISGTRCQGTVVAADCTTGLSVGGEYNRFEGVVIGCTNPVTFTGERNTFIGSTDGRISAAESDENVISGIAESISVRESERNTFDLTLHPDAGTTSVLLSGNSTDPCVGHRGRATVNGGNAAMSVQRFCYGNQVSIVAEGSTTAVAVQGAIEGVPAAEISAGNEFRIVARNCGRLLFDGGSNNDFQVVATGCTTGGILQETGSGGRGEGSRYTGVIRNTKGRLCELKGGLNTFDLQLHGESTAETTHGLLIGGSNNQGTATVTKCNTGVRLNGDRNRVKAIVEDCGTAAIIAGNHNIVEVSTGGNVSVTGDNNIIIGQIGGTVTDTGANNLFLGDSTLALGSRDVEIEDHGKGVILRDSGGDRYRVTIDTSGNLETTQL